MKPEAVGVHAGRLRRRGAWKRHRLPATAVIAVGAGIGFVVGSDGSVAWQVIRVALSAGLCWFVYVIIDVARSRRAGVVFAVGCLSVAIGVGIGVPHLTKTGVTPTTVAGLAVLVGGFVLLLAGGADLIQATPRWWRGLVVPALIVAVVVSLWTLGQAVAATNVPRTSVGSVTPADRGLLYRDVEFETEDGVSLSGWYVPSVNDAAVVLMHGAGSTRADVLDQAEVLADHGFGVLLFDARGHGRSEGRAMDFGWYGDEDTMAAVSFLQTQPDVGDARIAAVGLSMGGEQAIGAAAADPRIRAVVAEGATNRIAGDKAWLSEQFEWRGALQERIDWLTYAITDVLTAADQPITLRDAAAASRRPMLLIAGGAVENESFAGDYIRSGSPETVELWVAPGAGHTAALDTHPHEWEARVVSFLAAELRLDLSGVSPAIAANAGRDLVP